MTNELRSGIYQITNVKNGKFYIGSAKDITIRWNHHRSDLNLNKHHSRYLQRSWNKHGAESFEFKILEHCELDVMIGREQYYMDTRCPDYNMSPSAWSRLGIKASDETRSRISKAKKLQKWTDHQREVMVAFMKGNQHSKGRVIPEEERMARRESCPLGKAVIGYTDDTEVRFTSVADAARTLGLKSGSSIFHCLAGKRKTSGGYRWRTE